MRNIALKLFFLLLMLSLTVTMTGVADAMEFADGRITLNGFYKNWTGYRFGFYGHERGSGLSIFRNVIQLEASAQLSDKASLVAIYRLAREPKYKLEEDAIDAGNFDRDVLDENEFREYYLTWQPTDNFWTAIGKQQVAWGDLSGIGLRVIGQSGAVVAIIADGITVTVELCRIGIGRAIVAGIAYAIHIGINLVSVGGRRAVI